MWLFWCLHCLKGTTTVEGRNDRDKYNRNFALKSNAPFISFISKINGTLTDNTEDFDVVMPMYNLIEYSKNYLWNLWNFYKDIPTDSITNSESFKYKASIKGKTVNNGNTKEES